MLKSSQLSTKYVSVNTYQVPLRVFDLRLSPGGGRFFRERGQDSMLRMLFSN